jgi:hypothetical protein
MKTILSILAILLFTQIVSQEKSIKIEQLFITNKPTGKSVKLFTSNTTLKNFGDLIKIDTMYLGVDDEGIIKERVIINPDHFLRYTFKNIIFYINEKGKISSFYTRSPEIIIEKKGLFSISPGNNLSEIKNIFPEEFDKAYNQTWGREEKMYTTVFIQLSDFNNNLKNYTDIDFKIGLLFNPETKILEEIFIWIRP